MRSLDFDGRLVDRRAFLQSILAVGLLRPNAGLAGSIIDIHQHTPFGGRSLEQLRLHQQRLGIAKTVLLPAGRHGGLGAGCGDFDQVQAAARLYPDEFVYFANERSDRPGAAATIRKQLKAGAIGIGEQKFRVACDSVHIRAVAELAREFRVPVLMHFQFGEYNTGFERFDRVLEAFPDVTFVGHAQTWWGNIDAGHWQMDLEPRGRVKRGGLTDRWLAEYPNLFGDLSGAAGLNALLRDEAFATDFLVRHQEKLLFGTDCGDIEGSGGGCIGAGLLAAICRLCPDGVAKKILWENARNVLAGGEGA